MQLGKSIAFINLLIKQTKNKSLSWYPITHFDHEKLFPQLKSSSAYCCKSNEAYIAIGDLLPQYQETDPDIVLFVYMNNSGTYSLLDDSDLGDAQDEDQIRSKMLRLYNLIDYSDNSLEKFIDNYLGEKY